MISRLNGLHGTGPTLAGRATGAGQLDVLDLFKSAGQTGQTDPMKTAVSLLEGTKTGQASVAAATASYAALASRDEPASGSHLMV